MALTTSRFFGAARAALIFLVAAAAWASSGCASAQGGSARIVAIGDLHGDYDAYITLMQQAGLVDTRGRWAGEKAILVQIGDIPDRGPDTRKIISHLMTLEKQAKKRGGAIVPLIGNHEAMNVIGDLRYVHPGEYAAFKNRRSERVRENYFASHRDELAAFYRGRDPALTDDGVRDAFYADAPLGYLEHRAAWAPTGEMGKWVASHDAVRVIGGTLFLHGGLSAAYVAFSADEINERVSAALKGGDRTIIEDEAGPLWHRGMATETPEGEADVAAALAKHNVARIVIGHTPNLEGVKTLYGGRVIVIDTGASAYFGGVRSYIEIQGDKVTAYNNGAPTVLAGGSQ
jgi:hypothetical protein